jgi:hypothetical protein
MSDKEVPFPDDDENAGNDRTKEDPVLLISPLQ